MKIPTRAASCAFLLLLATAAQGASQMEVTASDAQGKIAGKVSSKADGTFTINNLPSGHYVVQFKSRGAALKSDRYLLILTAGKHTLISNAFPKKNFSGGGVAVTMDVGAEKKITGQVADATELEKAQVQVVNGRRYYWVASETGSNLGGRWVAESSMRSQRNSGFSADSIRRMQDKAGEGSLTNQKHSLDYAGGLGHGN